MHLPLRLRQRTALRLLVLLPLFFPFIAAALPAQRPLRICTYNVLDFGQSTSSDTVKVGALRSVISAIAPDLLALQEIRSARAFAGFRDSVVRSINPNLVPAPFLPDTSPNRPDNALLYDSTLFTLLASDTLESNGRVTPLYLVRERRSGDTLQVLVAHLQPASDRAARTVAARHIREYLTSIPAGHRVIVAGDLNLYTSSEEAYAAFLDSLEPRGRLVDPINMPGNWDGNAAFAPIHTHATRADAGRMNSRFDFILISPSLLPLYVSGSYRAFGNDGQHFNDSINRPPYAAGITPTLAQALYNASDHLPVVLDLAFVPRVAGVESPTLRDLTVRMERGKAVVEWSSGWRGAMRLLLYSLDGRKVAEPGAGESGEGRASFALDQTLARGLYLARVECAGLSLPVGRIVVLR